MMLAQALELVYTVTHRPIRNTTLFRRSLTSSLVSGPRQTLLRRVRCTDAEEMKLQVHTCRYVSVSGVSASGARFKPRGGCHCPGGHSSLLTPLDCSQPQVTQRGAGKVPVKPSFRLIIFSQQPCPRLFSGDGQPTGSLLSSRQDGVFLLRTLVGSQIAIGPRPTFLCRHTGNRKRRLYLASTEGLVGDDPLGDDPPRGSFSRSESGKCRRLWGAVQQKWRAGRY
jgi:hypothetical protein